MKITRKKFPVPPDFEDVLREYTCEGYRVVALGHKRLRSDEDLFLEREAIEEDLHFLGFVVLENRLKAETGATIAALNAANIKVVMVTGDNMLTALSVAKGCQIVRPETAVVTVDARMAPNEEKPRVTFARSEDFDSDGDDCVFSLTGKTWALVKRHLPELLPRLASRGAVFARMSPEQKQQLVLELRALGYNVGECEKICRLPQYHVWCHSV